MVREQDENYNNFNFTVNLNVNTLWVLFFSVICIFSLSLCCDDWSKNIQFAYSSHVKINLYRYHVLVEWIFAPRNTYSTIISFWWCRCNLLYILRIDALFKPKKKRWKNKNDAAIQPGSCWINRTCLWRRFTCSKPGIFSNSETYHRLFVYKGNFRIIATLFHIIA